jgi:O-antigen/teichoic acid export membrane protein
MSKPQTPTPQRRSERFLVNVLWNGLGFLVSVVSGILLSPYIIRKLGPEGYGVWSLVFALVDYFWLSDLGFRSSVLKFSAHYLAKDEPDKINQVVNTALVYFSAAAAVLLALTVCLSSSVQRFFQVSETYRDVFSFMLMVVGCSWAFGLINNTFRASLEGFQEYGLINRITIAMVGVRAVGCGVLLWRGYGLRELGIMVVAGQVMGYALTFACFRRSFPGSRFSRSLVNGPMLRQMLRYGIHTFVATVAGQLLNQGPPLLIGHLRSATWVGFFNLPLRLLMNTADAAVQVGMITGAGSADLAARGELPVVARMGVYVNRYCFTLYLPLVILTGFYGRELFLLWVGPAFAENSAPLLPVMAVGGGVGPRRSRSPRPASTTRAPFFTGWANIGNSRWGCWRKRSWGSAG